MSAPQRSTPRLGPALLPALPPTVRRPGYHRAALAVGMAHLGVGAFHRNHQCEFTDDMLERRFGRWGVVGITARPPALGPTLGAQGGLYTRLLREGTTTDARVIGCMLRVIDAEADSTPAIEELASPEVELVTLTVTEKGYCHIPATGALDPAHPDIAHDLRQPAQPKSVPGILAAALEQRMKRHGRPLTLMSCDNIPANGDLLGGVVRAMAEARGDTALVGWIERSVAFPSTMVDRIVPATAPADIDTMERDYGYADAAVVVGEPFRQWVIEDRFAGSRPDWDLAGATFVDDVTPFELMKMRVLNAAQSALAYLGVLAGYEHTCDTRDDPVLIGFVRRMLMTESIPTLPRVSGADPYAYLEQCLGRLRNTAILHRNHQIATDGSQKLPQRVLNPIRERLASGEDVTFLALTAASWMTYLLAASPRFGARWEAQDPFAARISAIGDRVGPDAPALAGAILSDATLFDPELAKNLGFRSLVARHLQGLLSADPIGYVRRQLETPKREGTR